MEARLTGSKSSQEKGFTFSYSPIDGDESASTDEATGRKIKTIELKKHGTYEQTLDFYAKSIALSDNGFIDSEFYRGASTEVAEMKEDKSGKKTRKVTGRKPKSNREVFEAYSRYLDSVRSGRKINGKIHDDVSDNDYDDFKRMYAKHDDDGDAVYNVAQNMIKRGYSDEAVEKTIRRIQDDLARDTDISYSGIMDGSNTGSGSNTAGSQATGVQQPGNSGEEYQTAGRTDTVGYRQNNPLNLRKSNNPWQGKVEGDGEFEAFSSMEYGYRAAFRNVMTHYRNGHNTIRKLVSLWAPEIDNNKTEDYIKYVSERTGIPENSVLDLENNPQTFKDVVAAMSEVEINNIDTEALEKGYNLAFHDGVNDSPSTETESPPASSRKTGNAGNQPQSTAAGAGNKVGQDNKKSSTSSVTNPGFSKRAHSVDEETEIRNIYNRNPGNNKKAFTDIIDYLSKKGYNTDEIRKIVRQIFPHLYK
ncbi:hypothetical protein FACS1894181_09850 [Bacteroidia bacterium]|nr:hypothetical protein FACS1894181_09850 [Bacteroidia bacterium]